MRKNFKLEDNTVIKVRKATENSVIFEVVGVENGFVTLMKLNYEQCKEVHTNILKLAYPAPGNIKTEMIRGIHMKHREYTRLNTESNFSAKYFESKNSYIQIVLIGNYCVINLGNNDKTYRSMAFRIGSTSIELFDEIAVTVNEMKFRHF